MDWDGKVCVVTGASSGFGRATAKLLAERGATVVVAARREHLLKELVDEMGGEPHSYVTCDVGDLSQVRQLVSVMRERSQWVDVLINNAGIPGGAITERTSEEMEKLVRVNLLGTMWCTKEFLPLLDVAPRRGRTPLVINVASMAGRFASPGSNDYYASKFGLVGFTESIYHDLGEKSIRVMLVCPGFAETEGFDMEQIKANPVTAWAVMSPERVVLALVRGIENGSFEVRVQWWMHPLWWFYLGLGPLRRPVRALIRRGLPGDF
jgi:short-subunit dehydrogenase